jgi:TonB family protein
MPLPNLVAWTRNPGPVPVPASLNAKLTLPPLATAVVPPPPEITRSGERAAPALPQPAAVAPPPDTAPIMPRAVALASRPAVVQPPPEVAQAARPALPALPQPAVVVPAPETTSPLAQLRLPPAAEMRVVPPPPGMQGVASAYSAGQVVALGVSPASVAGPINVPAGNRRGTLAAGPSGRAGASALPRASSGGTAEAGTGSASPARDKLAGISIAAGPAPPPAAETAVVAAPPAHNLWAMAHIPAGLRNLPPRLHGDLPASPSAIDRQVFGNKKFYSVTLNMPNLNSRSGSWVIRFAELNEDRQQGPLTAPVVLEKVDPAYPGILMREHVEGTVTLYAVIGADGSVGGVRVLRGVDDRLDAAARDALEHCRFRPATKNGLAVALEAVIRIPFEVHRIPY